MANASDILIETLIGWNVDTVFGIPGDGINGIMEALRQRQDRIRFIQVRHEESAAFMACAYAKWTGRLGVCLATSGPGGIHLLNGLYDAKLDRQPVLAITGLQFHDLVHTFTQQDVELDKLFADVSVYNTRIMGAAHVENSVALACRSALGCRGVAHVTIPVDVQEQTVKEDMRTERNVPHHVSDVAVPRKGISETLVLRAAAILNAAERPCILAGQGALGASDILAPIAERLGAPVVKALLGKAVLPDDHPNVTGGIGLLGTRPSQTAMERRDALLIVGSTFPYIEFYPKPDQARAIQIDHDPQRIGLRYPVECPLVADAREALVALLAHIEPRKDRTFIESLRKEIAEWRGLMTERGTRRDKPMRPQVVAHELNKLLREDAIIATDSGTVTTWAARHLDIGGAMKFSCSGNLASMACALPYAIAGALAYPERQVVAFAGDGGLTMLLGELATCVKYRLDIKIVVIKNNSLGQIRWEQMAFLGNPEFGCELQPIDFASVARGFGVAGYRIEDAADCARTLARAMKEPGPVLIEAVVDPNEPPMPPKATLEQMRHLSEALIRGTPHGRKIALTIGSDIVRELV